MQTEYELLSRAQGSSAQLKPPETETTPASAHSSLTAREPTTTSLKGSVYALVAVVIYTALALTSWIIICVTSRNPIKGQSSYFSLESKNPRENIRFNERIIKTAEILHTITTLLTIPVTSAVCSMAFVVYMQAGGMGRSLNVGQLMALADQGWISPRVWARIGKMGSLPLYIAFIATILGSMSQILQTSFFDREIIQVPEKASTFQSISVKDIPSMFSTDDRVGQERGNQVYSLRSMIDTVSPNDVDAQLWGLNVSPGEWKLSYIDPIRSISYGKEQQRFPFFSELPSNFSTGMFGRQYVPRMNSTTNVTRLTEDEFTSGCQNSTDNGGFYVQYQKTYGYVVNDYIRFSLTACMPGDKRHSPWRGTRDRQDITEELYLYIRTTAYRPSYVKITTNSSLGYFELPSHRNKFVFGPLLDKDPFKDNKPPTYKTLVQDFTSNRVTKRDDDDDLRNITDSGNSTLITVNNPGPLALLADALFGNGSFIEARLRNPQAFTETRPNFLPETGERRPNTWVCKAVYPLGAAVGAPCISDFDSSSADGPIWSFLSRFAGSDTVTQTAFTHGIWAATKNWFGPTNRRFDGRNMLNIYYNPGFETFKPKISVEKMIVGCLFLALHLVGLWVLALVATFMSKWTPTLGAEAMVRVGMAHAVPLSMAEKSWREEARRLPGYIGDARPGSDVGRMEMGAKAGLSSGRRYEILK